MSTCGCSCTCRIYRDQDCVMRFLKGLNNQFSKARSQILMMDSLPSMNKVYSLIIQQERQFLSENGETTKMIVVAHDSSASSGGGSHGHYGSFNRNSQNSQVKRWTKDDKHYNNKKCIHCCRGGHIIDECLRLHDFSLSYKKRESSVNNATASKTANESEILTNQEESQQFSSFSLTKEQYNSLLTLLQQSQLAATPSIEHHAHGISNASTGIICNLRSLPRSVLWILDSGATDHINSSLYNFVTYIIIPDIPIKLPNGTIVYANIKGTVIFSITFILHNVLYIPRFNFNLILVSQLAIKSDCFIRFTDQICEIHDNHTMRMIDVAKIHYELYVIENPKGLGKHFAPTSISINSVSVNKMDDWHFRLGHLSKVKLSILSTKFNYISNKTCNDFCQICPLAKPKRLPFPVSTSSSNKFFDLLHMDIWNH